jgi:hypothetical protein
MIFYDKIQASAGQGGSPIFFRYLNDKNEYVYQIIGVHYGQNIDECNIGTYFGDLEGLKKIFGED